jgi:hypothetical protein
MPHLCIFFKKLYYYRSYLRYNVQSLRQIINITAAHEDLLSELLRPGDRKRILKQLNISFVWIFMRNKVYTRT